MIPENRLSTRKIVADYLPPEDLTETVLEDFERGGTDLNDASDGLRVQNWHFFFYGNAIYAESDTTDPTVVLTPVVGGTEVAGTFDQNMRPTLAYMKEDECWLYWYDTLEGNHVTTKFAGVRSPRITLDDKRASQFANSDILLFYIKNGELCYRQQRNRFGVERVIKRSIPDYMRIKNVAMTKNWRLKILFEAM